MVDAPAATVLPLCFGAVGIFAAHPDFWTLPTSLLTGAAAAGGIALISSIGNLVGSAGPYAVGWVRQATGGFPLALLVLAALPFAAGVPVLAVGQGLARHRLDALAGAEGRRRGDLVPGSVRGPSR